jgi:hypothetical protein
MLQPLNENERDEEKAQGEHGRPKRKKRGACNPAKYFHPRSVAQSEERLSGISTATEKGGGKKSH